MLLILFISEEKKLHVVWRQYFNFICLYLSKLHTNKIKCEEHNTVQFDAPMIIQLSKKLDVQKTFV